MARIGVIGGGAFGTAMACVVRRSGHDVVIWAREPEVVESINRDAVNPAFLRGVPLTPGIRATNDLREAGLTARISSIHVNGWFGSYDKLATTRILFEERFGLDLERNESAVVFVGDSPNDAPMFAFFANSVGVANVRRFEGLIETPPRYVTRAASGAGFVELARHLLGEA